MTERKKILIYQTDQWAKQAVFIKSFKICYTTLVILYIDKIYYVPKTFHIIIIFLTHHIHPLYLLLNQVIYLYIPRFKISSHTEDSNFWNNIVLVSCRCSNVWCR